MEAVAAADRINKANGDKHLFGNFTFVFAYSNTNNIGND